MKIKRIIALILSLVTITSVFSSFSVSAQEVETSHFDVLRGFGLCEEKNPEDIVTRADMAKVVAKIYYDDYPISNTATGFSDVPKNHWASGYINLLWMNGIISGDGDRFYPDYSVKAIDAVCMLLKAAGYAEVAKLYGSYPQGYIKVSQDNKLLSKVNKSYDGTITYADLAAIFINYLEIPYMRFNFTDNGGYINNGKSILEEVYEAEKIKGQIIGDKRTLLVSPRDSERPVITIKGVDYIDKNLLYQKYLGYNVVAYVRTNSNDDAEVLYVKPTTANSVDSYKLDHFYARNNQLYYEGKSTKHIKIDERADFVYNGVTLIPWDLSLFETEMGTVDLLDNDSDGDYDLITMNAYENYFVDHVNPFTGEIVDKNGKESLYIDAEDYQLVYSITQHDMPVELKDIKENHILTISRSKNTIGMKYMDIKVSENSVEGRQYAKDEEWIKINNQSYRFDKSIAESLSGVTEGRFYLDIYGNIAAYENLLTDGVNNDNSGIFYSYYYNEDSIEDSSYVKLVTLDGKVKRIGTTEKVSYIQGETKKRIETYKLFEDPQFLGNNGYIIQLINYKLNSEGLIDTIIAAVDTTGGVAGGGGRDRDNFSLDVRMTADYKQPRSEGNVVYGTTNMMPYNFYVNDTTKIISLPRTIMQGKRQILEEDVLISSSFYHKTEVGNKDGKQNCEDGLVYDCTETNIASVIINFYDKDRSDESIRWEADTDALIVSDKKRVIGADDEIYFQLTGSRGTTINRVVTATGDYGNSDCENVKPGDVLQCYADYSNGKLFWARRRFTLQEDGDPTTLHLSDRKRMLSDDKNTTYFIGKVMATDKTSLMIDMNCSDGYQTYFPQAYTNIVIMQVKGKKVELSYGQLKDISKGMTVVGNTISHILRDLIVIKED